MVIVDGRVATCFNYMGKGDQSGDFGIAVWRNGCARARAFVYMTVTFHFGLDMEGARTWDGRGELCARDLNTTLPELESPKMPVLYT